MRIRDRLRTPKETRESVELGSKETAKEIIRRHNGGKKAHAIATELGLKELQVIRVIKDYDKRKSDKGQLAMVSAFGRNKEQEEKSFSAFKSALSNFGGAYSLDKKS